MTPSFKRLIRQCGMTLFIWSILLAACWSAFNRTLLTGTIAGAAFLALFLRTDWKRYWTLLGVALTMSLCLLRLPYPELWTPEVAFCRECLIALLAVFMGIQLVCHTALTLVSVLLVGMMGMIVCHMPQGLHWGYRGLAFVSLAAAFVLWATWIEMDHAGAPLQRLAVKRLRYILAVQAIYCGAWEYGAGAAGVMAIVSCLAYCWFMFGITQIALNGHADSPGGLLQAPEA